MASSPASVSLADYLFARLRQLGVGSIHGVPGDFNLKLLDHVEPAGLHWVGNCNELNAGYAADGYARIKGMGALITTFGVGELSAINAIAGAYAERAPVVHVVGTPPRATQDSRLLVHHTFNDGEYRRFAQMHALVTVAQADLRDLRTAPDQIDHALRQCLLQSRPVYITLPDDMVGSPVSSANLAAAIELPESVASGAQDDTLLEQILERMYAARQPIILVDGETRSLNMTAEVQQLIRATRWPTWVSGFAKGLVDETPSHFHGVYRGAYGDPRVKAFVDAADLVLCFGPHFSSTNSFGYTSVPNPAATISFGDQIKCGDDVFRDVPAKDALARLLQRLDTARLEETYRTYPDLPRDSTVPIQSLPGGQAVSQDRLWRVLAGFLQPGDIVMAETGTAGYGCRDLALPPRAHMFVPVTWLSIGYMLPAAQGAALAQRELGQGQGQGQGKAQVSSSGGGPAVVQSGRTILLIGDGSFQMTVQELGTIVREKLDVVVFLLNNDGYTIERCIHGLAQPYNDVAPWRYLQAPSFFGAPADVFTATVKTWGDLDQVLRSPQMAHGSGLRMVEIVLDREDVPSGPLLEMMKRQKLAAV